jgi:hypothetical protein
LQPRAIFAKRYFITNVSRRIMMRFLTFCEPSFLESALF